LSSIRKSDMLWSTGERGTPRRQVVIVHANGWQLAPILVVEKSKEEQLAG